MSRSSFVVVLLALILLVTGLNLLGNFNNSSHINGVVTEVKEVQYELKTDEANTKREAEKTKATQVAGGPVAVCLRLGIERALPALEHLPGTAAPFAEYVLLQSSRYKQYGCPGVSAPASPPKK